MILWALFRMRTGVESIFDCMPWAKWSSAASSNRVEYARRTMCHTNNNKNRKKCWRPLCALACACVALNLSGATFVCAFMMRWLYSYCIVFRGVRVRCRLSFAPSSSLAWRAHWCINKYAKNCLNSASHENTHYIICRHNGKKKKKRKKRKIKHNNQRILQKYQRQY